MDPQCSGKSAALLSEFDRRLLPLLHQHLDMTVKKKPHNDFFVQGGKMSPAAPNVFFSALVCNDAPNNSGSVFFFPPPAERHPQSADKTSGRAATACLARFCLPRELWSHRRARRSLRPCAASRVPRSPARLRPRALQTAPFPRPGEPSADRAPAPKTPPFPRHRLFCRSAPPSGAGKIVRAFPKAAEAAPPSTNVFRRCGGMLRAEPLARSGKGAFPQPRKHSPPDDRRWAFDSRCPSPRGVLHPPASLETPQPSPKAHNLIPRHSHFFLPPCS